MGRPGHDLDLVVTQVDPQNLERLLAATGKVDLVGASFAVFKWRGPGQSGEPSEADVALPRSEFSTGIGHRDFEVTGDPHLSVERDLDRRDFTVNAMAIELPQGNLVDPHGGQADLHARRLRAVGDPGERFREDPLRILRGAGFAARFELDVVPATREAMQREAPKLASVSAERIAAELAKLLTRADRPSLGLSLLRDCGALAQVLPEFTPSVGFDQANPHHHLPLDDHVFRVVDEAALRTPDLLVRLAALLHDLGKPSSCTEIVDPDGSLRRRFIGHERASEELARTVLERLRFSGAPEMPPGGVERICRLVRNHLLTLGPDASTRALRRLVRRMGGLEDTERLIQLRKADQAGQRAGARDEPLDALMGRIRAEAADVVLSPHQLALGGGDLGNALGLAGPALGALQRWLLDRVVDGSVANEREALLKAARSWRPGGETRPALDD